MWSHSTYRLLRWLEGRGRFPWEWFAYAAGLLALAAALKAWLGE